MSTFARQNFSDQLSIDTPEGVALRFPVAGIGSRGIAVIVDHLIQGAIYLLIGLGMFLWGQATSTSGSAAHQTKGLDTAGKWFVAAIVFVLFCVWWGYFALFEAFWQGQTPGKRLMKLRVTKDAGRQIPLSESMARNLLRVVDLLPSWYMVGVITMVCNQQNKRVGDLAAGTIVVHEAHEEQPMVIGGGTFITPPVQAPADGWGTARAQEAAAAGVLFPADALARLGPSDLLVIDTFFARVLDLPMETRSTMAQRIVMSLCGKMGVPAPDGHAERALEAMLQGLRSGARRF